MVLFLIIIGLIISAIAFWYFYGKNKSGKAVLETNSGKENLAQATEAKKDGSGNTISAV